MRLLRVLVATSFAALIAQPSAAQDGRPFHDAWFWGVKGGTNVYSSNFGTDMGIAPMVGLDWLITRTRGGLYVSADQSFLSTTGAFKETSSTGLVDRVVDLKHMQRISLAMVGFPLQTPMFHPYVGLGAGMNRVGSVNFQTPFAGSAQANVAADSVSAKKVTFAPFVMLGAQQRLPGFSVFAHGTATWLQKSFFLHSDPPRTKLGLTLEGGVRYNIGSSIDRQR